MTASHIHVSTRRSATGPSTACGRRRRQPRARRPWAVRALEVGYEVAPEQRGRGLGRRLVAAACGLVPAGEPCGRRSRPATRRRCVPRSRPASCPSESRGAARPCRVTNFSAHDRSRAHRTSGRGSRAVLAAEPPADEPPVRSRCSTRCATRRRARGRPGGQGGRGRGEREGVRGGRRHRELRDQAGARVLRPTRSGPRSTVVVVDSPAGDRRCPGLRPGGGCEPRAYADLRSVPRAPASVSRRSCSACSRAGAARSAWPA